MSAYKRTKDLTEEEILRFNKEETLQWMERILNRLYKLLEYESYLRISKEFVQVCKKGLEYTKRGLVKLVELIKVKWKESQPVLTVVK